MKYDGLDINKVMFDGEEIIRIMLDGVEIFSFIPPPVVIQPENLIVYDPDTWDEFTGGGTIVKNSTGLTYASAGSYAGINLGLSPSTEYLSLINIVSNGLSGTFKSLNAAFSSITIANAGQSGYIKNILTTKAVITSNRHGFYTDFAGGITVSEIRLFLSTPELRADWVALTAPELNDKYPYSIISTYASRGSSTWEAVKHLTWGGM